MSFKLSLRLLAVTLASLCLLSAAYAAGPEDALAATVKAALNKNSGTDWQDLEKLPGIKWAPLPPTMLQNCLPDGGCFSRQGTATIGDRKLVVIATGARTIVSNIYLRNGTAAFGEDAVVAALKRAGLSTELARCPVKGSAGSTNWYRLKSASTNPGYLSVQSSCNGRPCEGFAIFQGEQLPALQPNQLRMYSEQCSGSSGARKPVSTVMPQDQLAQVIVALLPSTAGAAAYDWKALTTRPANAKWNGTGPIKWDLTYKGDPNPLGLSGSFTLSGREFSLLGSGTSTQVKVVYLDENRMHPRGEDVLGVLRTQGFEVKLARCGPVYTESTNNWYSLTSAGTRPVMLQQSLRFEGKQVQDAYVVRLDNTLPKRDPRDRDPGVSGCK